MRRSALGAGEVATQLSQLVLELLDTPPQVFHDDVPRLRTSVTVAHHGLQPGQHDVRLADPAAQALVVRRAQVEISRPPSTTLRFWNLPRPLST